MPPTLPPTPTTPPWPDASTPPAGHLRRTFLSWHEPCLPQAADWVLAQLQGAGDGASGGADLSEFTLVVSGARAGRRLLEILVEKTVGRAMTPPRIMTVSKLPELFYQHDMARAEDLTAWLLRAQAIHDTPASELAALLPHPPKEDDAISQLTLAQEIQSIADELASHQHTFASVAQAVTSLVEFDDHARWDVLANLDEKYHQLLAERDLIDTNLARAQSLATADDHDDTSEDVDQGDSSQVHFQRNFPGRLVLIATTELPPVALAMMNQLTLPQHPVDILIHADPSMAAGFDEAGRLNQAWWEHQPTELAHEQVHLLDRPGDQAYHIARLISTFKGEGGQSLPRPDQITVGLGDQNMAPLVTRTLANTNVPTRHAAGKVINQSPPAMLLQQIATLLTRHTTRELAQALRFPAIEERVRKEMGEQGKLLLTHLDKYITAHLSHRLSDTFLEDEQDLALPHQDKPDAQSPSKTVSLAWRTLLELLPADWDKARPLSQWSEPVAQILQTFLGQRDLQRFDPDDAILIRAIEAIATALAQQADAPNDLKVLSRFTLPQAIQLLLIQVAGQLLPPESGEPAVELLGWLELHLDDAPHLIITGFNEGLIPKHVSNHWLLPDTLRQQLGLPDNRSRYVRDLYMLKAINHSRQHVELLAGRMSEKGEPLTPSRLLLAADEQQLPHWVEQFYSQNQASPKAPLLIRSSRRQTTFTAPPRPLPLAKPITELSVTAFRDYLACPYRFYLKHVLKLVPLDDRAVEMDAMSFGVMAHEVLQLFAKSPAVTSSNPQTIQTYLNDTLSDLMTFKFGSKPPAVIHIQHEIMRQRLNQFAHWQAFQVSRGWAIDTQLSERTLKATLEVDDSPFTIQGRIDRCDHHPDLGHRLLDYKTGDNHKSTPEKTHRRAKTTWTNLQLPLYRELARSLDLQGDVHLGFVMLPKNLAYTGLSEAHWDEDEIESAVAAAHQVIRDIRDEKFWPPAKVPRQDEFAGICMDNCLNKPNYETGSEPDSQGSSEQHHSEREAGQ